MDNYNQTLSGSNLYYLWLMQLLVWDIDIVYRYRSAGPLQAHFCSIETKHNIT